MRKIKKYEVDSFDSLVYAVSLVQDPAMESGYEFFNATRIQLADDEKRVVVGAVLVPDKDIYRYDENTGMEYFLSFSRKAVRELSEKFLRDGFANNWTLDHERGAEGLYTVESWLKSDMERDKSVALGIDPSLPIGTWFMTTKINDDSIWKEVKDGRWSGFSVEAYVSLLETEFSKQEKNEEMNEEKKNTFFEKVRTIFDELFNDRLDETQVEMEAAEPAEEPEAEPEVEAEPEAEDDTKEPEEADGNTEELSKQNQQLSAQVEELLAAVKELKEENEKLSKQPSTKPVEVKASKQENNPMDIIRQLHEGTYFKN